MKDTSKDKEKDSIKLKDQDIKMTKKPDETGPFHIEGHIKIFDPESGHVYINKRNAIHYENMSLTLAESVSNQGKGWISEMCFGNGGTTVDPTGVITYLTPNSLGTNSSLYNQTYYKIIDKNSVSNLDTNRNKTEIRHTTGYTYTDIVVSCMLDYGEPLGQAAFDNVTDINSEFAFDELGLRSYNPSGPGTGRLLTHVIFHPVQKSLNRLIQIDYTVRIQSLSGFNS
jgi:hypothetical protein